MKEPNQIAFVAKGPDGKPTVAVNGEEGHLVAWNVDTNYPGGVFKVMLLIRPGEETA